MITRERLITAAVGVFWAFLIVSVWSLLSGLRIDWNATGAMLSGLAGLAGAIAIAAAAYIGRDTFSQWKRQKTESRRFEIAEDVLSHAYICRDRAQYARRGDMWEHESAKIETSLREKGVIGDDDTETKVRRTIEAQQVLSRLSEDPSPWAKLSSMRPVCRAVFAEPVVEAIDDLLVVHRNITLAAVKYAGPVDRAPPRTPEARERENERIRRLEATFWDMSVDGADEIRTAIDGAIEQLEGILLPVLRSNR